MYILNKTQYFPPQTWGPLAFPYLPNMFLSWLLNPNFKKSFGDFLKNQKNQVGSLIFFHIFGRGPYFNFPVMSFCWLILWGIYIVETFLCIIYNFNIFSVKYCRIFSEALLLSKHITLDIWRHLLSLRCEFFIFF